MKGGDGVPRGGALGGGRGPLFAVLLLVVFLSAQSDGFVCEDHFSPTPNPIISGTVGFTSNVNEITDVGTPLLDFSWEDGVFGTPTVDSSISDVQFALQYLNVAENNEERVLNVTVSQKLDGLTDYVDPGPKDSLLLVYTFPVVAPDDDTNECTVRMVFELQDQNTVAPSADASTFSTEVREDFPTQYAIPNLQVLVTDLDGEAPNNVLDVTFDEGCPLTTEKASYDAGGGNEVAILFVLKEKLDYDTMETPFTVTCSVKISDQGVDPSPLDVTLTITVTVLPIADELPQFQSPVYKTVLTDVEAPSGPLVVTPADLQATDADQPPQTLAYSMEILSGEDDAWENYFSVDSASGALTQTQNIDPSMLGSDYSIHFVVTAEDDSGAKGTTVLEIVLPSAPTTSTTSTTTTTIPTTTSTTTTPTTTSSTTTTSTTTTPTPSSTTTTSTTTSTTTVPPSTTTCTPCETTTSTTWTTPLLSSTTVTESITSTPSATTTTTTTDKIPTTTEPTTCTCPTFESTTSTTSGDETTTTVDPSASPSTTTTIDPSVSPPPSPDSTTASTTTTTESPAGPTYRFEFQAYHFQPFASSTGVGSLKVKQSDGEPLEPSNIVTYNWTPESSPESDGFLLDQTTGDITMNGANTGTYKLVAQAVVDGGDPLSVDVFITVVEPPSCDSLLVSVSPIEFTVKETASDLVVATIKTDEAEPVDHYCITQVSPDQYEADYFSVNDQGEVRLLTPIDADPEGGRTVKVRVEAQKADDACPKTSSGDLQRNEALVLLTIEDENDQPPVLVTPSSDDNPTRVGYPTNRGLQQVVGPVITLNTTDGDSVGTLDFTLSGDDAGLFAVHTDSAAGSGALYLLDHEACDESCDVTVTATDGANEADGLEIEVHSLELSSIYDISLDDMSPKQMEDYVNDLSVKSGLDLHILYFSLSDSASATRVRRSAAPKHSSVLTEEVFVKARSLANIGLRGRLAQLQDEASMELNEGGDRSEEERDQKATSWTSLVHIYGFDDDDSLVSLDALNSALADAGVDVKASEFSEKATFDPTAEDADLAVWKTAVGVLGALMGLVLVAAIVGFVWYRRKQRRTPAKQSSPLGVSTIGSAYPNHGYEDTEMNRLDTMSTSSGGSYKNSGFKKALGNGTISGDSNNNNNKDKTESVLTASAPAMVSPFTSATVSNSPTYADPVDSVSPPPRDTSLIRSTPAVVMSVPREPVYTSPMESSARLYESSDSESSQRDDSQYQGGLRRITPAPLRDGPKSSPYLTKSEGDYEAFRPSDTEKVASFTPYKGGEGKGSESPTLTSKPASPKLSSSYKPVYKPGISSYLDDVPRREVRDTSDKKEKSESPLKQTRLDTSPYAFPVKTKKEPPNLALAAPAKPIMKTSKDSTLISTNAEVHHSADDTSSSGGGFSKLKGSPPPKQKSEDRERKSSLKYYTSEGETSDSELKKSVAFKVLVDEKLIKRRKDEKEEEVSKEKKASDEDEKKDDDEEETEDL